MKKALIFLLALLYCMAITACQDEKKSSDPKPVNAPVEKEAEVSVEEEAAVADESKEDAETKATPEPSEKSAEIAESEKKSEKLDNIFESAKGEYYFSSGAGGWGTELELDDDGEFEGEYHDSEMGEFADNYPDGTVYFCEFEGSFVVTEKLNDYSYALAIRNMELENIPETEEIRDKIRYVFAEAYGLTGSEFILYSPETPISELSEECFMWYMRRGEVDENGNLGTWCIYDVENQTAFYMYE